MACFIKFFKKTNPNIIDNFISILVIACVLMFIIWGAGQLSQPFTDLQNKPISLEYSNLFAYSFRTLLRMLIAMVFSVIFTFIYATIAASNKKCAQILIPLLDILQSLPVLGYVSFTVSFFLFLFPTSVMGAELAAIFAIFTSQVWNMIFSFYSSLANIPQDLMDAAYIFKMSRWRRFWQVLVPYAMPSLVWNMVISISSGWFFVVASEVLVVGTTSITLPGIGSYISLAIQMQDLAAIIYAIIAMSLIIVLYDQLLLRPLVVWSHKFSYEMNASNNGSNSLLLNILCRSWVIKKLLLPIAYIMRFLLYLPIFNRGIILVTSNDRDSINKSHLDYLRYLSLSLIACSSLYYIYRFLYYEIGYSEIIKVVSLSSITLLRIIILIIIVSLIWVPVGVYIGLKPRLAAIIQPFAQFLAAFPINLLFPVIFIIVTRYNLNCDIWLSPLIIMGTQWYILFNVISGAASIPNDLLDVAKILKIKGWRWWSKVMLPAITPHFITGAIAASGGAWNASIVAEVVNFGGKTITAKGIGSYIAEMTVKADFCRITLAIGVMAMFVLLLNRLFWLPLNEYAVKRFKL
jgi:NitT/TauT family transport system permease protein